MKREDMAKALRALAKDILALPVEFEDDYKVTNYGLSVVFDIRATVDDDEVKKMLGDVVKRKRGWTKVYSDYFKLVKSHEVKLSRMDWAKTREFRLVIEAPRGKVCTKRVVGTKVIPATTYPAQTVEERVEEIVEWDCPPSLMGRNG